LLRSKLSGFLFPETSVRAILMPWRDVRRTELPQLSASLEVEILFARSRRGDFARRRIGCHYEISWELRTFVGRPRESKLLEATSQRIRMESQDRCRALRAFNDPPSLPENVEDVAFLDFLQ
jgi:hypothetical protein